MINPMAQSGDRSETPGLYPGVDALEYHQWGGASQSRLKVMRDRSPAHLRWQMDHPSESTPAQQLGAAIHTCILEPDTFGGLYIQSIPGDGRTKAIKELRAAQAEEFPNHIQLAPRDWETCFAIRDSVAAHPHAKAMLGGEHEATAVWTDPDTGVLCRGRFDAIALGVGAITDLKSTQDASPNRFPADVFRYGYHIQAAHYLSGAKVLGIAADTFGIVAVEKVEPYAVAVYQIHAASLFDGERERKALLELWARCESSGIWPSYSTDVITIDLPAWAPRQIDERLERMGAE